MCLYARLASYFLISQSFYLSVCRARWGWRSVCRGGGGGVCAEGGGAAGRGAFRRDHVGDVLTKHDRYLECPSFKDECEEKGDKQPCRFPDICYLQGTGINHPQYMTNVSY